MKKEQMKMPEQKTTEVKEVKKPKPYRPRKNKDISREDLEMLRERTYQKSNSKRRNICDTHMDGA